jgi:flagellar biosynthesis protein FlhB
MSDEGGEKTEEPTDKKIDDARKKGQVWKSRDLSGVAVFLVGLSGVKIFWPTVESEATKLFHFAFDHMSDPADLKTTATLQLMLMGLTTVGLLTLPIVGACAIVGALVDFVQVGPLFAGESIMPKLDKLNPLAGLKNMFSKKQLVELLKQMIKIGVAGYVVYGVVRDAMAMVVGTIRGDTQTTLAVLGELVFRVSVRIGLLFTLFAIFDVWFQRRSYMKDMMMTKEEVKREYKESEGDPHHKAKRREMHMEILESAQMDAVRDSDVVVTNPDHVAVALKYTRGQQGAPRVLAKGTDDTAQAIKAVAREANVAIMRNIPLAHALLALDVGDEVPPELYDAVAEVLSFVYGLSADARV